MKLIKREADKMPEPEIESSIKESTPKSTFCRFLNFYLSDNQWSYFPENAQNGVFGGDS